MIQTTVISPEATQTNPSLPPAMKTPLPLLTPSETAPSYASPTPRIVESRWYDINPPIAGTTITSPIRFTVSTNLTRGLPTVYITLLDNKGQVLAQEPITIEGKLNQPGIADGLLFFPNYTGEAYLTIRESIDGPDVFSMSIILQAPK